MFRPLRTPTMLLAGIALVSLVSGCVTPSGPWTIGKSTKAEVSPSQSVMPAAYAPAANSYQRTPRYSSAELASWKRGAGGYVGYASNGSAANCHT